MSAASLSLGLVLDLSHAGFAAVLSADGEDVRASAVRPGGTRHDDLGEWLEELLARGGGAWRDLAWICIGIGPGSFTGIRIAMAFAQGVAMAQKLPLHGFTSFEALFLSFPAAERSVAAVAANGGRFYVSQGLDDEGRLVEAPVLASLAATSGALLVPAPAVAFDAVPGFSAVLAPGAEWDARRVARHARASGRGAERPCYLQASAAEDKADADRAALLAAGAASA